jgi:hypothetical protein
MPREDEKSRECSNAIKVFLIRQKGVILVANAGKMGRAVEEDPT